MMPIFLILAERCQIKICRIPDLHIVNFFCSLFKSELFFLIC